MRGASAAVLGVLAALLLAACGSADGDAGKTTASTVKTTSFTLDDPAYRRAAARAASARKDYERLDRGFPADDHRPVTVTVPASPPPSTGPKRPRIVQRPIPFSAQRKQEMAAYSERHYGDDTATLRDPKVIVEHFTETPDVDSTFDIFAADTPDSELGELPNTCAHFVVDKDGTIYQFVPLRLRCRHTVGLNWTAIGIEQVGSSDQEILDRPAQMRSIVRLTRWLQCREGIATKDVIGHNESLTSPYHREDVASLRTQTHDDWPKADMDTVRARLGRPDCG